MCAAITWHPAGTFLSKTITPYRQSRSPLNSRGYEVTCVLYVSLAQHKKVPIKTETSVKLLLFGFLVEVYKEIQ